MEVIFWLASVGAVAAFIISLLCMVVEHFYTTDKAERLEWENRGNWILTMALLFVILAVATEVHDHVEKIQECLTPVEVNCEAEVTQDAPVYDSLPNDWWK